MPQARETIVRLRHAGRASRGPLNADVTCHLIISSVIIAIASLVLAAAITLFSMLHGAGWKFEWSWFYPWTLSPYAVFLVLVLAVRNATRANQVAGVIAAVMILLLASFMYLDAMFVHVSSTSALIFIFGPFYLMVGGTVAFMIATLVGRKLARKK
jgi:hypothetical protein